MIRSIVKSVVVSLSTHYLFSDVYYSTLQIYFSLGAGMFIFLFDIQEEELRKKFRESFGEFFFKFMEVNIEKGKLEEENKELKERLKTEGITQSLKVQEMISKYQEELGKCKYPLCKNKINKEEKERFCKTHSGFGGDKCSICLDTKTDEMIPLRCNHFIHSDCVKEWMKNSEDRACPNCRMRDALLF